MTDDFPSGATASDLLRFVAQTTADGVVLVDPEGRIEWCNPALSRLVGRSVEELTGSQVSWLFPQALRTRFDEVLSRAAAGELVDRELESLGTTDGRTVPVAVSMAPLQADGRERVAIYCRDLSELVTAQETLTDLQARARTTEQLAGMGAWVWDVATDSVQWSEGMHELVGVGPLEFEGTLDDHLAVVDPPYRGELRHQLDQALTGGEVEVEVLVRRPDGDVRWICYQGAQVQGPDGRVLGLRGIAQDLTERHAAISALLEADQLKDEFLATVSHELRTPLTVILGFSEHLMEGVEERIRPYVRALDRNAHQMHQMVERLLDFSRLQSGRIVFEPRMARLRPLVEEAISTVDPLLRDAGVEVKVEVDSELGAWVDPEGFNRVLVNLLTNAVKFSEDGGPVIVTAQADNDHVAVSVADQGIGIPPEHHDSIFERFVQLAETPPPGGRGAGVGLSIVARYVDLHGGRVWVDSEVGRGSTFTFTVPREKITR